MTGYREKLKKTTCPEPPEKRASDATWVLRDNGTETGEGDCWRPMHQKSQGSFIASRAFFSEKQASKVEFGVLKPPALKCVEGAP